MKKVRDVSLEEWLVWSEQKYGKNSGACLWLIKLISLHGENYLVKDPNMKNILEKIHNERHFPNNEYIL